jgi:hypothetical protein
VLDPPLLDVLEPFGEQIQDWAGPPAPPKLVTVHVQTPLPELTGHIRPTS